MGVEKFCGIKIFEWKVFDDLEVGKIQFYHVEFLIPSMEKYNGCVVTRNINGRMIIYNNSNEIIWKGYVTDIPEVMEELNDRYKNS